MSSMIYESIVTAALSASLVSLILLDATSIQQILDKIRLLVFGTLLMVFGRDKRWKRQSPELRTWLALERRRKKRIVFVRHGESEWNLIFNKGSKLLLPFKALAALLREAYMFASLDPNSILYDSPLNQQGMEQAQEVAAWLREHPNALPEVALIVSSNLRRALQTVVIALQDRLLRARTTAEDSGPTQMSVIHVLSSLQEVSTNIDTISILVPKAAPSLPRVPEILQTPAAFDVSRNLGNKPLRGTGRDRILAFCEFAFDDAQEDAIIVGCHSLWARYFFNELLPRETQSPAKTSKIANGGIVSCDLVQGYVDTDKIYCIDPASVQVVYKGFDSKVTHEEKPKAA